VTAVREVLAALLELQRLDLRKETLEKEREATLAPDEIETLRAHVQALEAALAERRQRLAQLRRDARWQESEAKDLDLERARQERKLYSGEVRNIKELEQLQVKVDEIKAKISDHETRALEALEAIEGLEPEIRAAEEELARQKTLLEEKTRQQASAVGAIETELEKYPERREAITARIDPKLLENYEYTRRRRGGVAVAALEKGLCGACRVKVPSALAIQVRDGQLVKCENCGRILVLER